MDKFWKILGMVLLKLLLLAFVPTMPAGYFWGRSVRYRKSNGSLKSGGFAEQAYEYYANKDITRKEYFWLRFKLIFVDWTLNQFYEDWYTYM